MIIRPIKVIEMHEDLKILMAGLQAEKAALLEKTASLHARRDELIAQIRPLEEEEREIIRQYQAIERPRLGELDDQIAALAMAMGGRRLSNPEAA